ncbi:MAG: polysaccharide deacetylase family protein (PEP-CTERM system associated) [Rhodothermales bacterium]|jgi:polysaccharide deacetylase family protein (PEP-CTERM system associated)
MTTKTDGIFSIDFEDWHQLVARRFGCHGVEVGAHLERQTDLVLNLLESSGTTGTFFVLASLCKEAPSLLRRVASAGHEIASHGFAHQLASLQSHAEFKQDVLRARLELEDTCGTPVLGYRAPEFSISHEAQFSSRLSLLAEAGYKYDSSLFPTKMRRYGYRAATVRPFIVETEDGPIEEYPVSVLRVGERRLPIAGGGYFRLLPYAAIRPAVKQAQVEGRPFTTYFHPYEFDTKRLSLANIVSSNDGRRKAQLFGFHQNLRRRTTSLKTERLLLDFNFTSFEKFRSDAANRARLEILG